MTSNTFNLLKMYRLIRCNPNALLIFPQAKVVRVKKSRKTSFKEVEWKENDPTVPVNWKMRQVNTGDNGLGHVFII